MPRYIGAVASDAQQSFDRIRMHVDATAEGPARDYLVGLHRTADVIRERTWAACRAGDDAATADGLRAMDRAERYAADVRYGAERGRDVAHLMAYPVCAHCGFQYGGGACDCAAALAEQGPRDPGGFEEPDGLHELVAAEEAAAPARCTRCDHLETNHSGGHCHAIGCHCAPAPGPVVGDEDPRQMREPADEQADRDALQGLRVFVYWNLHRNVWSVRAAEGPNRGRVVAHADALVLVGVTFKVSEAGRQRVLREGRKNVHAGALGTLLTLGSATRSVAPETPVSYNPRRGPTFYNKVTGEPVMAASSASFNGREVLAVDAQ